MSNLYIFSHFFFSVNRDHRDQPVLTPSFPTRRASDLGGGRDRAWDHAAVRPAVPVADLHVDRAAAVLGAGDGRERDGRHPLAGPHRRSEEHTSELQSLMRISYAVFCLKKKKSKNVVPHVEN